MIKVCLNALESGRVIVTRLCGRKNARSLSRLNALESGRVIVTRLYQHLTNELCIPVSMPWKAGESLLPFKLAVNRIGTDKSLNALESGRVIVTTATGSTSRWLSPCLNALESGRVIVTDPILEAGGSRARKPRIANLPS